MNLITIRLFTVFSITYIENMQFRFHTIKRNDDFFLGDCWTENTRNVTVKRT